MILRCLAVALIGLLIAADDTEPDLIKRDLDKLQGTWQVLKLEVNGTTAPAESVAKARFVVEGQKAITKEGDKVVSEGFLRIDPRKKPAELEISPEKLPVRGKTSKGIYRFDGEMLKLAIGAVGEDRPSDFTSLKGTEVVVFTLKREKR